MSDKSEVQVQKRFIKSPDTKTRDANIKKLLSTIKEKDAEITEISKQLDKVVSNPSVHEERKRLINELNEIKAVQNDTKGKRDQINSKIKETNASLKRKINEISSITSKYPFKSIVEIDSKVQKLEDEISSGSLSLVDEKLIIKEISSLKRLKKDFVIIEKHQKLIDLDKASIDKFKNELTELNSSSNSNELSDKFNEIQNQLNELSSSNKSVNDKRKSLFAKRDSLYKEKADLYKEIKQIRAEIDNDYKAFKKALEAENLRFNKEVEQLKVDKSKSELKTKLNNQLIEASKPAFKYEIDNIHTLLNYFDPTYVKPVDSKDFNNTTIVNERKIRTVEDLNDYEIIHKKDDDAFVRNNQSNKKHNKKSFKNKKFILEPNVISSLGDLEIALPTSQDETVSTIESLKAKLQHYLEIQDETTTKNIAIAKAKIAEAEAKWAKEEAKDTKAESKEEAKVEDEE